MMQTTDEACVHCNQVPAPEIPSQAVAQFVHTIGFNHASDSLHPPSLGHPERAIVTYLCP